MEEEDKKLRSRPSLRRYLSMYKAHNLSLCTNRQFFLGKTQPNKKDIRRSGLLRKQSNMGFMNTCAKFGNSGGFFIQLIAIDAWT